MQDIFCLQGIFLYALFLPMAKTTNITIRLPEHLAEQLRAETDRTKNPYAPTISAIVARGIELALREMERKAKRC